MEREDKHGDHPQRVINLHSLKGENIDAYVQPKSPIEDIVMKFDRENPQTLYRQSLPPKVKRPGHLRKLAKNIVPTF